MFDHTLISVPVFEVDPGVRAEHWYSNRTSNVRQYPDHRHLAKTRYTNVIRYLFRVFVGEIPDALMLVRTCSDPGCINPFHHRVGAGLHNGPHLNKFRSRRDMAKVIEQSRPDDAQEILDLVEFILDEASTVTLQKVVDELAQAGISATGADIRAALSPALNAKVL
ncbi:hypothetical protein [Telmatospirillum sp.]|uniref:hypothetical protein n=1 Tax=Telmatospirillum sp. TaxID=2079197 RepID=UPI00284F0427|nr:hypothetical protein [Telmatospirillum sp.]MDR3436412.1 hypothetical protein [Telmatospirillum sp.]